MKTFKLKSSYDGLMLYGLIEEPKKKPVGIVQISHGMAENKERYNDFMKFLSNHGYIAVIHDHRGHGKVLRLKIILDTLMKIKTY